MDDVIQIDQQYYVLASSSLADDRSRVLKYGRSFAVLNRLGDIESRGLGEQGLYHEGTRFLSRYVVKLGGETPQLLRSTVRDDNAFLTVDAMNVDISEGGSIAIPRGSLHLFRAKFLCEGLCYEHIRLSNYSLDPVHAFLVIEFDADYRDIFEVRGAQRERRGEILEPIIVDAEVRFAYRGLDGVTCRTAVAFSQQPVQLGARRARFDVALRPKQEFSLYVTVTCECGERRPEILGFDAALRGSTEEIASAGLHRSKITSADARFNNWLARSASDVQMMMIGNPEGAYPYAGVPWFSTVFGRDGILTAMECLWLDPHIAKCVLRYLAETQATEVDSENDAEPGKIIHETRGGEMARLREIPFGRYYGSIDATPLFVMLAGAYLDRTDDREFLQTIWPNVQAALVWIETYGDLDRDGFVEYQKKSQRGLIQQGWKDSHDAVFYASGRIAEPPIALCEVQGYAYAAKLAGARLARAFESIERASELEVSAATLKEKFNRDFWDEELGTFAMALDGSKNACRVKSSNPGHCLFTGIANADLAVRVAESLTGEELFSGWGIRTLGSSEVRYNPMAYHNGSVWPHDNAIAAAGLARYGFHDEAMRIFSSMLDVSELVDLRRLPELFCGFHRRAHAEGPTLYPVACSPQAWAAGAIYMLIEACLQPRFDPAKKSLRLVGQALPPFLNGLTITNLGFADASVDIRVESPARGHGLNVEVLRRSGRITIES